MIGVLVLSAALGCGADRETDAQLVEPREEPVGLTRPAEVAQLRQDVVAAVPASAGPETTAEDAPGVRLMKELLNVDDATYLVGIETCLRKIFRNEKQPEQWVKREATLSLARNEYEPFQVLVRPLVEEMQNVHVTVGHLKQVGGNGVIPAWKVKVEPVGYVPLIRPYYSPYYMPNHRQKHWPDPLLEGTVVPKVTRGEIQPFWVTVYAPADVPAGDYVGTIRVQAAGAKPVEMPLKVHVWDFTLPKESHLPSVWLLYGNFVAQFHNVEKGTPEYAAMMRKYHLDMLEHRMQEADLANSAPCPQPKLVEKRPDGWVYDFKDWDEYVQFYIDRGLTIISLPLSKDMPKEEFIPRARAFAKHLAEKDWLKYNLVFLVDESYECEEQRRWVHEADPRLRNALTQHPKPDCPAVDVWISMIYRGHHKSPESIEWGRKAGKELWVYTAGNAETPFPSMCIDAKAIDPRITIWFCWKQNYTGYLYWCVNYWVNNPWETGELFPRQNGNGSVYYPGRNGPVHSMRLELHRDGMEDYEYFWMLKQLVDKLRTNAAHAPFVAECDKLLVITEPDIEWVKRYEDDSNEMLRVRAALASRIEQARKLVGDR